MKILITGGAGFIGSHLAEKLLGQGNPAESPSDNQAGNEVFVLDDLSTGSLDNIKHLQDNPRFHFKKGSVLDEGLVEEMVSGKDQVYHLAAVVGVKRILGRPLESLLTNIKGTEIVLEKAFKHKVKALVVSSSEVCGKGDNVPFSEDDDRTYGSVKNDRWIYAFSKAVDEFLALAYFREKHLPVVVVRLFNVIGPRQTGRYGMVVPTFVRQALKEENITVYGDGEQSRCFAAVSDVVGALTGLMQEPEAEGELFNVGSDSEITMNDLAEKVKEITGSASEIIHISYKEAYPDGYEDFRRRKPDLSKIKQKIGYEPKVSLKQSIEQIIEFEKNR